MIQYIIWLLSFFGLWTALFWVNYLYFREEKVFRLTGFPYVSIAIPAFNEEKTIKGTIESIINLDYPKDKLEIIAVNDGSTDATAKVVKRLIKNHQNCAIKLINKQNKGKAEALNTALRPAKGELFACVDADSELDKNALKAITPNFKEENIGVVISAVKVRSPRNLYERIQKAEYILANLARRLTSKINTLAIAHGGLSIFRTSILRKIGGFSKDNGMTEDLEVAMRMRYNGYAVRMEWGALSKTAVPRSFKSLWRQRLRWYRGYIYNHLKFREMFFNKKYGRYGSFQMPFNFFVVLTMLIAVSVVGYGFAKDGYEFMMRMITIKGYLLNHVLKIPDLSELVLGRQVHIYFPIVLSGVVGAYLVFVAHRQIKESLLRHLHMIILYFTVFPYITALHWISAITQEIFNHRRRWR